MSEKIYLLPKDGNFYKANLHCHTTLSDGKMTPEEIKTAYKSHGYSIVAFSDHRIVVPHPELEDEDFLPLTASEYDCNEPDVEWPATRTYHLNFISKDKNRTEFVPFVRIHSVEGINKVISDAADAGFICQYNHPRWSMNQPQDFIGLKGLYAFEIYNTGCDQDLFSGEAEYEYEVYSRYGEGCPVTACDDNHSPENMFGGFTMIKAPSLDYDTVINALCEGDFYASRGPVINELYIEDGRLHIECSPVCKIGVFTDSRACVKLQNYDGEETYTVADLPLDFKRKYLRVVIEDSRGRRAWTRAYYGG